MRHWSLDFPAANGVPRIAPPRMGRFRRGIPLTPLARGGYPERTRQNVLDSDGTAILFNGVLGGGTLLTLNLRKREGKPHVTIDASKTSEAAAAAGGAWTCARDGGESHCERAR